MINKIVGGGGRDNKMRRFLYGILFLSSSAYALQVGDLTVTGRTTYNGELQVSTMGRINSIWFVDGTTQTSTAGMDLSSSTQRKGGSIILGGQIQSSSATFAMMLSTGNITVNGTLFVSSITSNNNLLVISTPAFFDTQVGFFDSTPNYGIDIGTTTRSVQDIYMQNTPSLSCLVQGRGVTYNTLPAPGSWATWGNTDVPILPAMIRADGQVQYRLAISACTPANPQNFDLRIVDATNGNANVVEYDNITNGTTVGNAGWTSYSGGSSIVMHDLFLQIEQHSGSGGNACVNAVFLMIKGQN